MTFLPAERGFFLGGFYYGIWAALLFKLLFKLPRFKLRFVHNNDMRPDFFVQGYECLLMWRASFHVSQEVAAVSLHICRVTGPSWVIFQGYVSK